MSEDDTIDLSERLEALEQNPRRARAHGGSSPVKVIVAILGVSALWGGILVLSQSRHAEATLAVAEPEEFQITGRGWEPMPVEAAAPEPIPVAVPPAAPPVAAAPSGPSDSEMEMMRTLAELRAELEAMREAAARPGEERPQDDESAAQIARLSAQVAALTERTEGMQDALEDAERLAEQRGLAVERLEAQLQLAQAGQAVPALPPGGIELDPNAASEAARLAVLEERRAQAEADREARVASPILAFGGSGGAGGGAETAVGPELGSSEEFVRLGARAAEVEQATVIANPSRTVIQGTVIQAVLETAIDSSLPGAIRAVVSEDVHSYDGTRVLIPRGSKLIGRYNAELETAQSRVLVAWDRIVTPDNQSVEISAYGGDELGRSGVTGAIDRRLGTRFGSAALVSLISALPAVAAAAVDDPVASEVAVDLGEDAEATASSALDDYLSVKPVIHVDQGTRITVMVDRDLELF